MINLKLSEQIDLIRKSKKFANRWYLRRYPDVQDLGISAVEHYLVYGAEMGRNPSPRFDTRFYQAANCDALPEGMNPFVHFLLMGEAAGLSPKGAPPMSPRVAAGRIKLARSNLLERGLEAQALQDLRGFLTNNFDTEVVCLAAFELALHEMRSKDRQASFRALRYLDHALERNPALDLRRKIAVARMICMHSLNDGAGAEKLYHQAARNGEVTPDFLLAWANHQDEAGRVDAINRVMDWFDLPNIVLQDEADKCAYDRLTCAADLPFVDGPMVSILIAAFRSQDTIGTTLRSLQAQTWRNFEALIIDDASDDETCNVVRQFVESDSRFKLIALAQNGGAYLARNIGLDQARGEYITIHDADDWSHPLKLETQARALATNPSLIATTSQQARMGESLGFLKWGGAGASIKILKDNVSSFMFRHKEVMERVGYWDTVRFGADSEKINRVRAAFGDDSVANLETGPMSLQRVSDTSIVSNDYFGMDGYFYGARLEYKEGCSAANEVSSSVPNYSRTTRFPVPQVMRPDRKSLSNKYDVIIASEFRMHGGSTRSNIEEMIAQKRAGLRTGIVQMYRYDFDSSARTRMLPEARQQLDEHNCVPIVYGENVECDLLIVRYPPVLQNLHRYLPNITAKKIKVIVNQPPRSDYTEGGVLRYDLARCAENIRTQFGGDAEWYPIGPLVRDVMLDRHDHELHHIDLSPVDWTNIIDIAGWHSPRTRKPNDKLRIGRHSRDNFVKWPGTREDVLAAYPEANDLEVHIMGGASVPSAMIGHTPANWVVHPFGAKSASEFLSEVDVFVYYAHPDWVEAFGRTIIEAMAVGVPVILPHVYQPLFRESAIYATAAEAPDIARRLHADPVAYARQVDIALRYCEAHFSYESHINRLRQAGVNTEGRHAGDLHDHR